MNNFGPKEKVNKLSKIPIPGIEKVDSAYETIASLRPRYLKMGNEEFGAKVKEAFYEMSKVPEVDSAKLYLALKIVSFREKAQSATGREEGLANLNAASSLEFILKNLLLSVK